MLSVTLLRHAKSSWDDPELTDFDRPLGPRGANAAKVMAQYIISQGLAPDLILCSSARRTRETLGFLLPAFKAATTDKRLSAAQMIYDDALYLANADALLAKLRALPQSCRHVMIVGHNPGLHALALDLIGTGSHAEMCAIVRKFPTAALATITFDADQWRRLEVGSGVLADFVTPRTITP